MEQKFCQSCGMPLATDNCGTNADGSRNETYCVWCYKEGRFTQEFTMNQMIEFCVRLTDQINEQTGWNLTPEEARAHMRRHFPRLERWQRKDERSLAEKAAALLAQCDTVVLTSVDADGFPRPVPMSKGHTAGYDEIWTATSADSAKVADFRRNPRAGIGYASYGDSVALRGRIEIVDDEAIRRAMWQKWYIDHFPGGPTDPAYVLLRFVGTEATFWIDREFAHEKLDRE